MTGGKWGDDEPGRRPESCGDIDCLYLSSGAGDYVPRYFAQVRIDFSDVRTGFRASIDLAKADFWQKGYDFVADLLTELKGLVGP